MVGTYLQGRAAASVERSRRVAAAEFGAGRAQPQPRAYIS
jgi:hypothetical protein